jgi:hypothetical protein
LKTLRGREIETLKESTLGKPSEVLIMRDLRDLPGNVERDRAPIATTAKVDTGTSTPDPSVWLDNIMDELRPATEKEFHKNLAKFGRSWPHKSLRESEWVQLRKRLTEGFTREQLTSFLDQNSTDEMRYSHRLPPKPKAGSINSSDWKDGQTAFFGKETDTSSAVSSTRPSPGKEIAADRIMRRCWGLHIRDTIGEIYMNLNPRDLGLLLHKYDFLTGLVKKWDARLDLSRSKHIMRVTALHDACKGFESQVKGFVASIKTTSLTLPKEHSLRLPNQKTEGEFLELIAEKNGTSIQPKRLGQNLVLTIASEGNRKDHAQNAVRDILSAIPSKSTPHKTFYFPKDPPEDVGALQYPMEPTALSLIDGQKKWSRIAIPHSRIGSKKKNPPKSGAEMQGVQRFLEKTELNERYASPLGEYAKSIKHERHANFCHVLHESSSDSIELVPKQTRFDSFKRRLISTDLPGTLPFFRSLMAYNNTPQLRRLRLNPSPLESSSLPPIEILFSPKHPDVPTTIASISAIIEERVADILLPHLSVDLRLTKRVYLDLVGSSKERIDLDKVAKNVRVADSHPLSYLISPVVDIDIPTHLLHRFKHGPPSPASEISETLKAKYLFCSTDRPESLVYNASDMPLVYRKVRLAEGPGSHKEIELSARSLTRADPNIIDEWGLYEFKKFFTTALKVASLLDEAAQGGPKWNVIRKFRPYTPKLDSGAEVEANTLGRSDSVD